MLLVKDAASEKRWQTLMDTYNVPVIAVLTSKLKGEQVLDARRPVLRGIITALKRGQRETGAVFEALVARVKALLNYNYDELWRVHRQQAPIDPVFDIPKLYRKINPARSGFTWEPLDLPAVLKYLPRKTSLGLYGIGPVWLYAAAACHTFPVQFFQFDARRGWVNPIVCKANAPRPPVKVTVRETSQYIHLKTDLPEDYLVYHPEMSLPLPPSPTAKGVVLDGKGPAWLYTGLALHFRRSPWVAVFYPQLDRAVVVFSKVKTGQYAISETVTLRK
ncbi:MAG: CRISPR-associated protein Csx3 [Anaerolineae bacterium]